MILLIASFCIEMKAVSIVQILDSRREQFRLSKAYEHFKRSGKKPSDFCKSELKMRDVKSYDFVKAYFHDPDTLVKAIIEYRRTANIPKGEYTLTDLLK